MSGVCDMFRSVMAGCLAAAIFAFSAVAEDAPLRRLLTADDARGWEAVGRLNVEGGSFCTGTLIAPDLVLTAAHCLHYPRTGRPVPADRVHFLAGWRKDWAAAHRKGRRIAIHPDFTERSGDQLAMIASDIALVELDAPIRNGGVTPFSVEGYALPGDAVAVVSYARDRSEVPSLQEPCHLLGRQGTILILSCSANFGTSGAPVFVGTEGNWELVSVITSVTQWNERDVSLGAPLGDPVNILMRQLREEDAVFKSVKPGDRNPLPQVNATDTASQ